MKKILLVTFPVDEGSRTFEKRYLYIFKEDFDLKVYRFVPDQFEPDRKISNSFLRFFDTNTGRLLASIRLWKQVREANREGRHIVFQGISPAVFAYPAIKRHSSFIVTDWTRKLYEDIRSIKNVPALVDLNP